jgi:mono/diheme cytochrome c family protein
VKRELKAIAIIAFASLAAAITTIVVKEREPEITVSPLADGAEQIARGGYLALAGNCAGCHTRPGGLAYAGGRELPTPFGTFVTPNITADAATGIGQWDSRDFWRALHHGKGRDGRPLYPAFPYTEYTNITRDDADALFAYLRSLPTVAQHNAPDRLKFPYSERNLLYVWRAMYFEPGSFTADAAQSAEWNRGAYLVRGPGHCNACHTSRNALGAAGGAALGGGQVAGRSWYAPSLTDATEAGSGERSVEQTVQLLSTGLTDDAAASGPMADVVARSLQYLKAEDLRAMAVYLKSLSAPRENPTLAFTTVQKARIDEAARKAAPLYEKHCADCHGKSGEGAPGAYPALAGNRGVTMNSPLNSIRNVLDGGFTPTTATNPRPYGMPPFAHTLSSEEIALLVTTIRNSWGNKAAPVNAVQVERIVGD